MTYFIGGERDEKAVIELANSLGGIRIIEPEELTIQ